MSKTMNTLKQLQDFSPEAIAIQVMKAIEVADISDFNGKNVFEAGDYDAIFESIVDGVKQAKILAFEAGKAEAIAMVLKEISERDIFLLKELAEICREDDLLDLDNYDSISRSDRIGNAWEALKVIDKLDTLKTKLQANQ